MRIMSAYYDKIGSCYHIEYEDENGHYRGKDYDCSFDELSPDVKRVYQILRYVHVSCTVTPRLGEPFRILMSRKNTYTRQETERYIRRSYPSCVCTDFTFEEGPLANA